jgi:type IV pilus assembly protein PilV
MKTISSASSHRQGGFSLLEVLIAVLIFSIGLMGLAGLQVIAMKANQNAMYRSIASEAAYDMLDQLRAQVSKAMDGSVDTSDWDDLLEANLPGGKGSYGVGGTAKDCDPGTPAAITNSSETYVCVTVTWDQASVVDDSGTVTDTGNWQAQESDNVQTVTVVGQL